MSKTWSAQQLAIFLWFRTGLGNLIVRARAGTGKTTTILEAINHAPEGKILLAAFNKRIARELQERLGGWGGRAEAKTLNGLGFSFVKYAWGKHVTPDDAVESERVLQVCGGDAPDGVYGIVGKLVSWAKAAVPFASHSQMAELVDTLDLQPTFEQEEAGWNTNKLAFAALQVLEISKVKRQDGKISFDDQVWLPLVLNLARPWFHMVVIDEAQDMSYSNLLLAQRACKRGGRIVVVGDDCQAIYGFRGADSGSIDRLKTELKATELSLTTTYRCAKSIVAEAQQLVPDYCAAPNAPEGTVDAIGYQELFLQGRPGDFVLSRKNAPLMSTCLRFLRAGVPCRIEGRDIGAGIARQIRKFKARTVPEFLKKVAAWKEREVKRITAKGKDVESKVQSVEDQFETFAVLADGATNVEEIVTRCTALFEDSVDPATGKPNMKPAVICSSVHKAKGLEADRCFLLDDTFFKGGKLEEQNLRYVAITRAKNHLTYVKGLP